MNYINAFPLLLAAIASVNSQDIVADMVRVQLVGRNFLHLTEVMVYDQSGNNVALGKPSRQSSSYSGYLASSANNGNLQDFSHTEEEQGAWWEVDLEGEFSLTGVVVYNRYDGSGERTSNSDVILSNSGQPLAGYHINSASTNEIFDIPSASFVAFTSPSTDTPTNAPTSPPTSPPTDPTSPSCLDSVLNFAGSGGKGCSFIVENQEFCGDDMFGLAVMSHCPLSCDSCDIFGCLDSAASFNYGRGTFACDFLASLSDSDIETYCNDEAAYSTCRGTCNTCDL